MLWTASPPARERQTIGLDIAKSVFQVHGVDVDGAVVIRKRVSRVKVLEFFAALPPCFVGIEACPTARHWSRKLQALGHTVRNDAAGHGI
jgi:transposase